MSSEDTAGPLPGLMMDVPLLVTSILRHAVKNHAHREVVSRDGDRIARASYAVLGERIAQLANALVRLGVRPGDRVASFGWNTHRHLELGYAVPALGAVLHTADIRLLPDELAWTIAHAGDVVICLDGSLVPEMRAAIAVDPSLGQRRFIVMGEAAEHIRGALDYEQLIARELRWFAWPMLDERDGAVLTYTTATSGDPHAVLFSHRAIVVQALATAPLGAFGLGERDVVLPAVPLFDANAWGLAYLAPLVGAKLVLPGARLDAPGLIELIDAEGVTFAAGASDTWLAVGELLCALDHRIGSLDRVVVGGASVPQQLVDDFDALGVRCVHTWGMTELGAVGTVNGRFAFATDWKIIGADGHSVTADGESRGELWVRGPVVAQSYVDDDAASAAAFVDGWFRTGEIVTVDEHGAMTIVR